MTHEHLLVFRSILEIVSYLLVTGTVIGIVLWATLTKEAKEQFKETNEEAKELGFAYGFKA